MSEERESTRHMVFLPMVLRAFLKRRHRWCQWQCKTSISRIQDFTEGYQSQGEGGLTYYPAKFSRKLHENEEMKKLGPRGGRPKFVHFDPFEPWHWLSFVDEAVYMISWWKELHLNPRNLFLVCTYFTDVLNKTCPWWASEDGCKIISGGKLTS